MKILIAPDKFKGSLTAQEVCLAIKKGLKKQNQAFEISLHPMADGGDGSLDILFEYLDLSRQEVQTLDPLGRKISAQYFTSSTAAFIEVASASGLVLLDKKERNPLKTSTVGTGIMIADALSKGYQDIYLFLGGSATNDAGIGIASALGFQFLDRQKNLLRPIGENLLHLETIVASHHFDFKNVTMTLLCDVTNPLFGTNGAAHIYAPQKGASPEQIFFLDDGLRNFAQVVQQQFGKAVGTIPGSGAAGGISAGLMALLGAKIEKGFEVISKLTNLERQIQQADWVISGEGKLDQQSLQGKVIDGMARLCKKHKKPLALFVGKNELEVKDLLHLNPKYIYSIIEQAKNMEDAMLNGAHYLENAAEQISLKSLSI